MAELLFMCSTSETHHIFEVEHWEGVWPWAHLLVLACVIALVYVAHRIDLWWFVRTEERRRDR